MLAKFGLLSLRLTILGHSAQHSGPSPTFAFAPTPLPGHNTSSLFSMRDSAPSSPAVRFLTRLAASIAALFFITYSVDLTWFHLRVAVPRFGQATSSIHRVRVLAIPHNGNKMEFQIDALRPEEDIPCSRSLFPHSQYSPCWYVSRHANEPIHM